MDPTVSSDTFEQRFQEFENDFESGEALELLERGLEVLLASYEMNISNQIENQKKLWAQLLSLAHELDDMSENAKTAHHDAVSKNPALGYQYFLNILPDHPHHPRNKSIRARLKSMMGDAVLENDHEQEWIAEDVDMEQEPGVLEETEQEVEDIAPGLKEQIEVLSSHPVLQQLVTGQPPLFRNRSVSAPMSFGAAAASSRSAQAMQEQAQNLQALLKSYATDFDNKQGDPAFLQQVSDTLDKVHQKLATNAQFMSLSDPGIQGFKSRLRVLKAGVAASLQAAYRDERGLYTESNAQIHQGAEAIGTQIRQALVDALRQQGFQQAQASQPGDYVLGQEGAVTTVNFTEQESQNFSVYRTEDPNGFTGSVVFTPTDRNTTPSVLFATIASMQIGHSRTKEIEATVENKAAILELCKDIARLNGEPPVKTMMRNGIKIPVRAIELDSITYKNEKGKEVILTRPKNNGLIERFLIEGACLLKKERKQEQIEAAQTKTPSAPKP